MWDPLHHLQFLLQVEVSPYLIPTATSLFVYFQAELAISGGLILETGEEESFALKPLPPLIFEFLPECLYG
jgi:hypothetical protein